VKAVFGSKKMKNVCLNCDSDKIEVKLDLGLQPPSNRYGSSLDKPNDVHRLEAGACSTCGLVQLLEPMPIDMVCARYDWIRYNEPEFHLDSLVETLKALDGVSLKSLIKGLSYKDTSTLERFRRGNYTNTKQVCLPAAKTSAGNYAGLETIQNVVSNLGVPSEAEPADILLVRHVFEHAHDPKAFLKNISSLLKKDGYLVLEVPDSSKFIKKLSYSFLWEEHIVYFTETTLRAFLENQGFEVVHLLRYEAALEDSLVAVVRMSNSPVDTQKNLSASTDLFEFNRFVESYPREKEVHYEKWKKAWQEGQTLAVFGAGHLAAKYVNFFELSEFMTCVLDDSPEKTGLCLPGSTLPIKTSDCISEADVCLMALSPESLQKVLTAKRQKIKPGGRFVSIFDPHLTNL